MCVLKILSILNNNNNNNNNNNTLSVYLTNQMLEQSLISHTHPYINNMLSVYLTNQILEQSLILLFFS